VAYFGSQHGATAEGKFDGIFRCRSCGLEKGARARALGTGSGHSPFYLNEAGARGRAIENAASDAAFNAEVLLELVPCPSCGERDAAASRGFIRASVSRGALIVALAGGLGTFFLALGLLYPAVVAFVAATLGPLLYALLRRNIWRAAVDAVEFFDGEAPDRPITGKPCVVCANKLVTRDEGLRCRLCGVALHRKKCWKKHARDVHEGETGT
jgi:hypothetical protein